MAAGQENTMSDCLHCDIHDLLEPHLQREGANLVEIAAKVTEVLADLILSAAPEDRAVVMADILANLGDFVVQKSEEPAGEPSPGQTSPRRH